MAVGGIIIVILYKIIRDPSFDQRALVEHGGVKIHDALFIRIVASSVRLSGYFPTALHHLNRNITRYAPIST